MVKKWYPYELHTHTHHSDGSHSLLEMSQKATRIGLHGIALTDHNTISGLQERDEAVRETGIHIVSGLEWTTFYGHMVTLGSEEYVDWRNLSPIDIEKGIKQIHDNGGVAGIAHPYVIGSPICTGCYWEYEVKDWTKIDYIEVWSEPFPAIERKNQRAFKLWTEKLNEGYQISATSGRDWHDSRDGDDLITATYLLMDKTDDEVMTDAHVVQAIKKGKLSVTIGPLLLITGSVDGKEIEIGDTVSLESDGKEIDLTIQIDHSVRKEHWKIPEQDLKVVINSNQGVLGESVLSNTCNQKTVSINVNNLKWIRAELYGVVKDFNIMIAFTNPIYFK